MEEQNNRSHQVENEIREMHPIENDNDDLSKPNNNFEECVENQKEENVKDALVNVTGSGLGLQVGPPNVDPNASLDQADSGGDNMEEFMDQSSSNSTDIEKITSKGGIRVGENVEEDNHENSSQSFDLNTEPFEVNKDGYMDPISIRHNGSICDSKAKGKKQKKASNAKAVPTSMKLKDVMRANFANSQRKQKKSNRSQNSQNSPSKSKNSISVEMMKTKNIGDEIGFCLDGFEEMLRDEIEGEGVLKQQK
ncbi:hypothetical protein L2E82_48352 [Cichorium intybus]|uniref:Uncharacterized protein n=1 Tax=Cichorium intybus TaxID=13427 RepID=A0ACB8YY02_CICIN|nr:hypothetical protein L2E82_48352 [Cichorium intybus]